MVKMTLEIRHLESSTLSFKHPCKPAPCHSVPGILWVPEATKIHNIIVPEAGEKNQNRKLQYGQVSMYEGPALLGPNHSDSLWQKEVH